MEEDLKAIRKNIGFIATVLKVYLVLFALSILGFIYVTAVYNGGS